MMATKLETNFTRLLNRCEALAQDKCNINWRLEKYVGALEDYLCNLRKGPSTPKTERLTEYTRKVDLLKGIIAAEKLSSPTEKVIAADLLTPAPKIANNVTPSKELHLHAKARYQKEMRDELLGRKADIKANGELRHRKPGEGVGTGDPENEDIDTMLKYHREMQEKLADEMVHLAKNLKENAKTAGKIVQDDNKKLAESSKLADTNYDKLKVESDRLETHVQKSCNWWIWIMIVLVIGTFVFMVLFMRMFPKKS